MESILKMAILHLSIRQSESCIFAMYKPTIFMFLILLEDYVRINDTFGFFDTFSVNSEIELGLGSSQIKNLLLYHHFLRICPIALKVSVDPMIYFGSSIH
jgi:hypothetical protein